MAWIVTAFSRKNNNVNIAGSRFNRQEKKKMQLFWILTPEFYIFVKTFSRRTAQTLASGILHTGSRASFVKRFAAASR